MHADQHIDPTETIKVNHPSQRKLPAVLTINEIKHLLEQPNLLLPIQFRDRVIMEVLYSSGIRINELVTLKLSQINLKERELFVLEGKGGHQRIVPIGKRAVKYLQEYITNIRPMFSKDNPDEKSLFLTDKGNPVTSNTIRTAFFRYKKKAKITKPASPHSFRRCFATHLLQHGADIRHIQQLLGHKKLQTTQIYARVYPIDLKAIHNKTHANL